MRQTRKNVYDSWKKTPFNVKFNISIYRKGNISENFVQLSFQESRITKGTGLIRFYRQ